MPSSHSISIHQRSTVDFVDCSTSLSLSLSPTPLHWLAFYLEICTVHCSYKRKMMIFLNNISFRRQRASVFPADFSGLSTWSHTCSIDASSSELTRRSASTRITMFCIKISYVFSRHGTFTKASLHHPDRFLTGQPPLRGRRPRHRVILNQRHHRESFSSSRCPVCTQIASLIVVFLRSQLGPTIVRTPSPVHHWSHSLIHCHWSSATASKSAVDVWEPGDLGIRISSHQESSLARYLIQPRLDS